MHGKFVIQTSWKRVGQGIYGRNFVERERERERDYNKRMFFDFITSRKEES